MMKKYVILLLVFVSTLAVSAQVEPHAIGARLGGGDYGGGFEVNYQHGLGDVNRLEFGLGLNSHNKTSYMNIVGVYQWVWELGEGFNWYAGPGAHLLLISNNTVVGIGGQVGVEYNFNVNLDTPLLISLDTRPMWNFANGGNDFGWGAALGIRYTF